MRSFAETIAAAWLDAGDYATLAAVDGGKRLSYWDLRAERCKRQGELVRKHVERCEAEEKVAA